MCIINNGGLLDLIHRVNELLALHLPVLRLQCKTESILALALKYQDTKQGGVPNICTSVSGKRHLTEFQYKNLRRVCASEVHCGACAQ